VQRLDLAACHDLPRVEADLAAEVGCDLTVVAGHDLHGDAKTVEAGERLLDVGSGRVGEAEEALERKAALVVSAETLASERTAGDGNDARAGGEEPVECRLGVGGRLCAAGEDGFWGALRDYE